MVYILRTHGIYFVQDACPIIGKLNRSVLTLTAKANLHAAKDNKKEK